MGAFGDALGYSVGSMFLDQPPRTISTDPRTGYQRAEESRRIAASDAMAQEYARGMSDPNWGMGDPAGQRYMEQEIIDSVYNRLGAGGSLGSGTSKALASKSLVDYRLGLLNKRNQALQQLRADMMGPVSTGGTPYTVTPVEGQESFVKGTTGGAVKAFAGGMGAGAV